MKILMTGGTGFIGSHFIQRYPEYRYTVLTRRPAQAKKRLPNGVEVIDELSRLRHLDDFDAIINLAGAPIADRRWSDRRKQLICDSRWQVTQQLVDLVTRSQAPPNVFLSGSAIGIYGPTGQQKISEQQAPIAQGFAHDVCQRWETIASSVQNLARVVLLRTGVVLGADDGAMKKMLPPFKIGLGGHIGAGDQMMSWIHLDDQLAAMHWLLNQPEAQGPYNLTAPEAVSSIEFASVLAEVLGTQPRLPVPAWLMRGLMGEAASLLLDSQWIYPQRLLTEGFEFRFPQLDVALKNLFSSYPSE